MIINKNAFETEKYYLIKRIDKSGLYQVILCEKFGDVIQPVKEKNYLNRAQAMRAYNRIKKEIKGELKHA